MRNKYFIFLLKINGIRMKIYIKYCTNLRNPILERPILKENLEFGISWLHAWIRFFECCLHLSYRIEIKKWQIRGKDEKAEFEIRKKASRSSSVNS